MAFNINQFKAELDKRGGAAMPSLFEVIIIPISNGPAEINSDTRLDTGMFSFFCSSVNIPGININTAAYIASGALTTSFPTQVINQPINSVFMVDSDHQVMNFFYNWMQKIINHGASNPNAFNEVDGMLPYELGYKDEYATDILIRHYSTESFDNKYYEIQLHNAFPITAGDLNLAWENNNSFLTMPVAFSYDKISYSSTRSGTPANRAERAKTGTLLDRISAVAGLSSVLSQTLNEGSPVTIQDAINRISRVRNSFDRISSI